MAETESEDESTPRPLTSAELEEDEGREVFINAADGLPNARPDAARLAREELSPDPLDELPRSLIVTDVPADAFDRPEARDRLESLFKEVSPDVDFQWLRSFRRLRVNYGETAAAAEARIRLHRMPFDGRNIGCYFAQPVTPASSRTLLPPKPVKQFLISPPSSPPLGWEPRPENEPLVNRELLAAIAQLAPGDTRELLPPCQGRPSIVVHAALRPSDNQ